MPQKFQMTTPGKPLSFPTMWFSAHTSSSLLIPCGFCADDNFCFGVTGPWYRHPFVQYAAYWSAMSLSHELRSAGSRSVSDFVFVRFPCPAPELELLSVSVQQHGNELEGETVQWTSPFSQCDIPAGRDLVSWPNRGFRSVASGLGTVVDWLPKSRRPSLFQGLPRRLGRLYADMTLCVGRRKMFQALSGRTFVVLKNTTSPARLLFSTVVWKHVLSLPFRAFPEPQRITLGHT